MKPGYQRAISKELGRGTEVESPDGREIRAARSIDAKFADALAEAVAGGVQLLGRRCRVFADRVDLGKKVPAVVV